MQWLNKYTFPAEMRYSDVQHAEHVYPHLVQRLLANGTTTAVYYATIHLEATKKLVEVVEKLG